MPNAPTSACFDLVRHFEGLYLKVYRCPAGVLTIGYGHTGPDLAAGLTITEEQADDLLRRDLTRAAGDVDRLVKVPLEPFERDALTSFVFNLGAGALGNSTLLKRLNAGDREAAAAEFLKWNKATVNGQKKVLAGLVKRREAERSLFLSRDWKSGAEAHEAMPQRVEPPTEPKPLSQSKTARATVAQAGAGGLVALGSVSEIARQATDAKDAVTGLMSGLPMLAAGAVVVILAGFVLWRLYRDRHPVEEV